MRLARWESYFLRAHREAESERKRHLRTVMIEGEVKTPIRDINYIQVESVDYTQVMKDFASICAREVKKRISSYLGNF